MRHRFDAKGEEQGDSPQIYDELLSGRYYGVFIDDTGSPGLDDAHYKLHPGLATWVGVIVPPHAMPGVMSDLPMVLESLRKMTGATEFHFTDIYAGKGQFEGAPLDFRLALFSAMAAVFSSQKFPILTRTLDEESIGPILASWRRTPPKLGPFDLSRPRDLAFFLLLADIAKFVSKRRRRRDTKAIVLCDEGIRPHLSAINLPPLKGTFNRGRVYFGKSSVVHPIQLADFAAFVYNRTHLLLGREMLKPLDVSFMQILSKVAFNYQNQKPTRITLEGTNNSYSILSMKSVGTSEN